MARLLWMIVAAPIALATPSGQAQEGRIDPLAAIAIKDAGAAMKRYAEFAVFCDKLFPGTWAATKVELEKIAPKYWNGDWDTRAKVYSDGPEVAKLLEGVNSDIASRKYDLASMQDVCTDQLRTYRADAIGKVGAMSYYLKN